MTSQNAAADEIVELLDTEFLRALAEPARLEVLKSMLRQGGGDVGSISDRLPQDRSVVSRHLQVLEDAGIVLSSWEGRRRVYRLDGAAFVGAFETIAARVRQLAALCCPPVAAAAAGDGGGSTRPAPRRSSAASSRTKAGSGRRRRAAGRRPARG